MRQPARGGRSCAGALALVAPLTGCTAFIPQGCTAIGADSGVTVTLAGNGWIGPLTIEVCVAENCSSSPAITRTAEPVIVRNTGLTSTKPTEVVITVRGQGGSLLAPAMRSTVRPTELQPNGPQCEPTVWVAAATVSRPT
ncbi:hypothetical protein GCM10009740_16720 [Terrabacter terrae]|uniref:IPT/TIG domain-containing protein n=1 Tax=Terrabacter terrae TaxID=318434 RepID=A0ABP5FLQ7_9MICO